MPFARLRQELEGLVNGEPLHWQPVAEREQLFHRGLREAVELSRTGNPGPDLDGLWNLLTDHEKALTAMIQLYYEQTYGFGAVHVKRLIRNSKALVATAQVAVAAHRTATDERASELLRLWTERSAELLSDGAVQKVVLPSWRGFSAVDLVHRVYGQMKKEGFFIAAARIWTLYWLQTRGAFPEPGWTVPVVGYSVGGGRGSISHLELTLVDGFRLELAEHVDQALKPLDKDLLGELRDAHRYWSKGDQAVMWRLRNGADHADWTPMGGDSLGAIVNAAFGVVHRRGQFEPATTAIAGIGRHNGTLCGVGHEKEKVEKAIGERITRIALAAVSEAHLRTKLPAGPEYGWIHDIDQLLDFVLKKNREVPIITIVGNRGGAGKGTTVACIGQLIAELGHDVAIIDLDLHNCGTTRAAERRFQGAPVKMVFDHLASRSQGFEDRPSSDDLTLWDVTPEFLGQRGLGRIALLPACTRADQSVGWEVVSNILPPQSRAAILAELLGEMIDRVCAQRPNTACIIIDCGADVNPIYSAAVHSSSFGLIIASPDPELLPNVKVVRMAYGQRYNGQVLRRLYTVVNGIESQKQIREADMLNPVPVTKIWNDSQLRRDRKELGFMDFDLGYEGFSKLVRDTLVRIAGDNNPPQDRGLLKLLPDDIDVDIRPVWSLLIDDRTNLLDQLRGVEPWTTRVWRFLTPAAAVALPVSLLLLAWGLLHAESWSDWLRDDWTPKFAILAVFAAVVAVIGTVRRLKKRRGPGVVDELQRLKEKRLTPADLRPSLRELYERLPTDEKAHLELLVRTAQRVARETRT